MLLFAFTSAQDDKCDDSNKDEIVTVVEGNPKLITCICAGNDVHWHKIGAESDPLQSHAEGVNNLKFSSVTIDDAGTYVCEKGDNNHTIKTAEVIVTLRECPDFTNADEEALEKFRDLQHFDDTRRALKYGECLKGAVTSLIAKQIHTKHMEKNLSDIQTELERVNWNLTEANNELQRLHNKKNQSIQTANATVNMLVSGSEIHARDDLHVSCTMASTVVQKGVRFSWRWTEWKYINSTEDPNMNEFDWSVLLRNGTDGTVITSCGDSNSTCEGSNLTISAAHVQRSGRFFCVAEFPHDVGSVSHEVGYSDIRVVNPIKDLYISWNGTRSSQNVLIEIPHGTPLEVNCIATGNYTSPAVNMTAQNGDESVLGNESISYPDAETTTVSLTIPWHMMEGKDVKIFCKAIGDHESNRNISSKVEVLNPISLHLFWIRNGRKLKLNETNSIAISRDDPLEVNCIAKGQYATPKTVNMSARIDGNLVASENVSSSIPNTTTTTEKLTIPWKKDNEIVVKVECQAIGEHKSNHSISSTLKVSIEPTEVDSVPSNATISNASTPSAPPASAPSESSGIFGTPTVFGGIVTILVVVVVIGVVVVAYRSRDKLRSWIMEKDVSKAALRKAKYARAKGGRGWIKYAKLPRDISEAMSHNE